MKCVGMMGLFGGATAGVGKSEWDGEGSVRFGIIADVHHGLCATAKERLEAFMGMVREKEPDFILQLGDFCYGDGESDELMQVWDGYSGKKFHVLGNHDMDKVSKSGMVKYLGMPGRYYRFMSGGFEFVVMDSNNIRLEEGKYMDYDRGNYFKFPEGRGYIDDEQVSWFENVLKESEKPLIIFSHQGLAEGVGTKNQDAIKGMIYEHNRLNPECPVAIFFEGHHHVDRLTIEGGIHHHWVNSASYHWVGEEYGKMADYRDPLFAFITMTESGEVLIEGKDSAFIAPTPSDRRYPKADDLTASIVNRRFNWKSR